jgi:aryl-alcohol dehydrogenase-like predicted oxidoreductase
MEREIIPMARHFGMAIAPWDALGGGLFQNKQQLEERKKNGEGLRKMMGGGQNEQQIKISEALTKVAEEHGLESPTAIALAYVVSKTPNVFPIVGGRKVEHLKQNIKALEIKLTDKQIEYLESIVPFEPGFPNNFIGVDPHISGQPSAILGTVAPLAWVKAEKAIGHE